MFMNKKIAAVMICAGMALGVLTGCSSEKLSEIDDSGFTTETLLMQLAENDGTVFGVSDEEGIPAGSEEYAQQDVLDGMCGGGHGNGRYGGRGRHGNGRYGNNGESAEMRIYKELSAEILARYRERYDALVQETNALIREAYASVLGERYAELNAEYEGLNDTYASLVNGFYASGEYVALKAELDALKAGLAELERGSEEYAAVMAEIRVVWGKISVLAGEVNSEIALLTARAGERADEIYALAEEYKEELRAAVDPILTEFYSGVNDIGAALTAELDLLRESLGI
jgi:hypothetical protein